ncbi:MAG: glycosyltransferase [Hydrogenophaga sp.]|jgi:glycosyltransferase involved in cell wall biosynthesis|nr:glycosyltransferase [Hydrogenophaga sp.]
MRVAYFVNQYPKVSHSFIRREILALERQGVEVVRVALRGWSEPLVDADDLAERDRTHFLLRRGPKGLLPALLGHALRQPAALLRGMAQAFRMSRQSERPLVIHLVYVAEACALIRHVCSQQVRHVHAHFGTNSAEVVALAHTLGGPTYSFTVHGPDEFDQPTGIHLGEKIGQSAFVVAISSFGRSQLFRWTSHAHWHKVHVVHCGLDRAFHALAAPQAFPEAPRVVCVGRLCEQKGQLLLLDAVRLLKQRGARIQLVLAGDGEMRPDLEAFVARHGLQDCVSITGWISSDRVRQELLAARAMVLPSFAEGLPVVIMEAMALGRPVVTTSIAGIPELVRHGTDGWLIPAGDVHALVDALSELLDQTTQRLTEMGQAARRRVLERHSVDTEARKLVELFRAVA